MNAFVIAITSMAIGLVTGAATLFGWEPSPRIVALLASLGLFTGSFALAILADEHKRITPAPDDKAGSRASEPPLG